MNPEYKPIANFPGYGVTQEGKVLNLRRGTALTQSVDREGYWTVSLSIKGKRSQVRVDIAVAEAFLGPVGPNATVKHLDGNTRNNRVENLLIEAEPEKVAA